MALQEHTRVMSNNQLDHILADLSFKEKCFATSYYNFISDHKTITLRVTMNSKFTDEILKKITFDSEHHLKKKISQKEKTDSTKDKPSKNLNLPDARKSKAEEEKANDKISNSGVNVQFSRRFRNPDLSTCWLNSCLQLILSGLDHYPLEKKFESELGSKLHDLENIEPNKCIDPTEIKDLIIFTEDMRIAKRKSELADTITDKSKLPRMLENIDKLYLNMRTGQQCVRDFFICLHENMENWIDVYQLFSLTTVNLLICKACGHINSSEQFQIYLELDVPPEGSNLNEYVEKALNGGTMVEYRCEDGCNVRSQADKRSLLKSGKETQFIIIMLRRTISSEFGMQIVPNNVYPDNDIDIR